ncbi:hypothetical protein [Micromonospora sp. RV43]|uniref:hypothetical protein n=1 Tax=Micromonospora sp. RV43 TaxID=1661387 RepID=UPI00064BC401|nr:hypothetical protein [Micromonospora sp. RV43]
MTEQWYTSTAVEAAARALAVTQADECFDFDGPHWDRLKDLHRSDARIVLNALVAAGRMPAAHHLPLLQLTPDEVEALIGAAAADGHSWRTTAWRTALEKLAGSPDA